jgi:hypothetical protein
MAGVCGLVDTSLQAAARRSGRLTAISLID